MQTIMDLEKNDLFEYNGKVYKHGNMVKRYDGKYRVMAIDMDVIEIITMTIGTDEGIKINRG